MHAIDGMACAKRGCDNRGTLGLNIVGPGSFPTKWDRRWRYRCTVCGGTVNTNTGTAYSGLRCARREFDQVASLRVEGVSISATARVTGHARHPIARCFRHQLLLPRPYLVLTKPLSRDFHFADRIKAFIHQHASPHARFLQRTLFCSQLPSVWGRARRETDWSRCFQGISQTPLHTCALSSRGFVALGCASACRHRQRPDPPQHVAEQRHCCVNRNWHRALPRVGSSPIDRERLWSTKLGLNRTGNVGERMT